MFVMLVSVRKAADGVLVGQRLAEGDPAGTP
jgi:hypothetical protein